MSPRSIPLAFATTSLLLAAVGILASYIPERKATTLDSIIAPRSE